MQKSIILLVLLVVVAGSACSRAGNSAPAGNAIEGAIPDLGPPNGGIGRGAGRMVELIAPEQLPLCGEEIGRGRDTIVE